MFLVMLINKKQSNFEIFHSKKNEQIVLQNMQWTTS